MDFTKMSLEETLAHYGVPGMKWGVRNDRRSTTTAKKSSTKPKTVNIKSLSDDELRKIVNRMQLEQQYISLASKQSGTTSSGKKVAADIVKNAGKQEATKLVAKGIASAVGVLLKAK